jgi:hypothetical protein
VPRHENPRHVVITDFMPRSYKQRYTSCPSGIARENAVNLRFYGSRGASRVPSFWRGFVGSLVSQPRRRSLARSRDHPPVTNCPFYFAGIKHNNHTITHNDNIGMTFNPIIRPQPVAYRPVPIYNPTYNPTSNCPCSLLTDYQYGPGFPGFGLINSWMSLDATYIGHAWPLPHPFVKGMRLQNVRQRVT